MNLRNVLIEDALFTFIDLETTGLSSKKDRICEIAMSGFKNFKKIYSFSSLVNPQTSIPLEVVKLNGIDDKMVADKPLFHTLIPKIISTLEGSILVGHNVNFDISFLESEFERAGLKFPSFPTLDTWRMAVKFGQFRSNKLKEVAKRLGISCENWHRAESDIEMTRKIFEHFTMTLRKDGVSTVRDLIRALE